MACQAPIWTKSDKMDWQPFWNYLVLWSMKKILPSVWTLSSQPSGKGPRSSWCRLQKYHWLSLQKKSNGRDVKIVRWEEEPVRNIALTRKGGGAAVSRINPGRLQCHIWNQFMSHFKKLSVQFGNDQCNYFKGSISAKCEPTDLIYQPTFLSMWLMKKTLPFGATCIVQPDGRPAMIMLIHFTIFVFHLQGSSLWELVWKGCCSPSLPLPYFPHHPLPLPDPLCPGHRFRSLFWTRLSSLSIIIRHYRHISLFLPYSSKSPDW